MGSLGRWPYTPTPASSFVAARLKPGWTKAVATERCNYHWRSHATHSYCGTPLCERCVEAMGGAEHDAPEG